MERGEKTHIDEARTAVLDAALPEVAFDGWSSATLQRAIEASGVDPALAALAFPRGAIDLAFAFHAARDADLADWLAVTDLTHLRYSERVARAIEYRLDLIARDREAVRKAVALFALPQHSIEGARALWHTADTIWVGLGDTSKDLNYYTKRATLSAVWSSSVLYWLGDQSPDLSATRGFIARRIDNIMQIEKIKANIRQNPLAKALEEGVNRALSGFKPPNPADFPGFFGRRP